MFNLVNSTDLSKTPNYENLLDIMDMDDFVNLMAFVQCTAYYSWGWGISMYRENSTSGKWRTSIWDTDRSYVDPAWDGFEEVMWRTYGLYWANIIPQRIMASPTFKQKYSNRINHLLETVFKPDHAIAILDSLYQIIVPEMPGEFSRWEPYNYQWENNVENVREFLRSRPEYSGNK